MAEIPVERKEKKSFPWWMLIPLLLLLLLIPYVCSRSAVVDNTNSYNANRTVVTTTGANNSAGGANGSTTGGGNGAVVTNANNGASSTANAGSGMTNGGNSGGVGNSGAAVTDVNLFGTTTDKATIVGRNVNLSGVRVNRVLSDKVFTVKSGSGEMFIMLDDNLDSAGGKESQIKPRPGQNINLGGAFRNVPTGEVKAETKEGGLNNKEYAQMKGQQVYLHATSLSDAK